MRYIKYSEYYFVKPNGSIELCKIYNDNIYNYNFTRQLGEFYNTNWYNFKFSRRDRYVNCLDDKQGYRTRVFNPAGQDYIGGGCGQLFHTQKWMKEHAELTIHSIGHDKEKVHMPI